MFQAQKGSKDIIKIGFGTTWGWVINDTIFVFGWTIKPVACFYISVTLAKQLMVLHLQPNPQHFSGLVRFFGSHWNSSLALLKLMIVCLSFPAENCVSLRAVDLCLGRVRSARTKSQPAARPLRSAFCPVLDPSKPVMMDLLRLRKYSRVNPFLLSHFFIIFHQNAPPLTKPSLVY